MCFGERVFVCALFNRGAYYFDKNRFLRLMEFEKQNICACAIVMTAAAAELMLFLYNKLTLYR